MHWITQVIVKGLQYFSKYFQLFSGNSRWKLQIVTTFNLSWLDAPIPHFGYKYFSCKMWHQDWFSKIWSQMWLNFGKSPLWAHFAHYIFSSEKQLENFCFLFIYGSNYSKNALKYKKKCRNILNVLCDVSKIVVNSKIPIVSGTPIRVIFQNSVTNV